jgi:hypothetical protein
LRGGEQLLLQGWTDYALTATHTGTSYAACFRTNIDRLLPDLPPDVAWASGASDQRIFLLPRHRPTVAVSNETDSDGSPGSKPCHRHGDCGLGVAATFRSFSASRQHSQSRS